jgi:hypothetical protein
MMKRVKIKGAAAGVCEGRGAGTFAFASPSSTTRTRTDGSKDDDLLNEASPIKETKADSREFF